MEIFIYPTLIHVTNNLPGLKKVSLPLELSTYLTTKTTVFSFGPII